MFSIEQPDFIRGVELPPAFQLTHFSAASVKGFSNYLNRVYQSGIPLGVLEINSLGGDADCLYSFISLMKEYRKRGLQFCGIVSGFAYSAAAFVFLYCDKDRRFMGEMGNLMIHGLQASFPADRLSSIKNNTNVSQAQQDALFKEVSRHLKKKPDWLDKEMNKRGGEDWYISAAEAAALGFTDVGFPQFKVRITAEFSIE